MTEHVSMSRRSGQKTISADMWLEITSRMLARGNNLDMMSSYQFGLLLSINIFTRRVTFLLKVLRISGLRKDISKLALFSL